MGSMPYDPPSRRTPPNKQRIHPAHTRVVRDHTTDGDIEKNPGPVDAQATENDIPPHHRAMVTRLASEIETASNPHYPVKLYKYATQALTEALKRKRRAPTLPLEQPPPLGPLEAVPENALQAGGPGTRGRCAVPLHAAEHTPMRKEICMTGDDTQGGVGQIGASGADNQSS